MKIILFFYTLLASVGASAQSNYVSTYLENSVIDAFELHALPWDETRLYQYTRNGSSGYFVYTIDEIAFNTASSVVPPLCTEILQVPVVLDDGLLLVGSTASGKELLYFDEVNSTVFDLTQGGGDSDPLIYTMNERVFIVAFDGTNKQLFEFDKGTHTVSQVTNSTIPVESVCAVWGDDFFYRTKYENGLSSMDDYHLMKATLNGNTYTYDTITSVSLPSSPDRMMDWRSPQLFNGSLYLMGVNVGLNGSTPPSFSYGMININASNQVSTSSLVLPISDGEFFLVQWAGKLGVYSDLHDSFYSSTDGQTFLSDAVPVNGRLVECQVSENDQLYFNCLYLDETREVFEYSNGFQSRYVGEHLHFMSEHNGILYYSDYIQFDSSSVVLIYTDMDVQDEVKIHFTFHPPHMNTSVMFNGLFTFLFGSENGFVDENDIFQLTGSPSAGLDEVELELSLYPNPIQSGNSLEMRALRDGEVQLIGSTGNVLKHLSILNGEAKLNTSSLSPGVYFISFMNHTQRIVVN